LPDLEQAFSGPRPPWILDGGTGRELKRRGAPVRNTIWSAASLLEAPDAVVAVHRDYIESGAEIITTGNYTAIPHILAEENLQDRFVGLTVLAGQLAQEARNRSRHPGDRPVRIAGCLPPLVSSYRPDLVLTESEMLPLYRQVVAALNPFVDLFLCETMSSSREAHAAAQAAVEVGRPVWVSFTLEDTPSGKLRSGESLVDAVTALDAMPVAAFLVNCSPPESIKEGVRCLQQRLQGKTPERFWGAYPNAYQPIPPDYRPGGPQTQLRDDISPENFVQFARGIMENGAKVVGGCCGIGPEYIRALWDACHGN
jgi:S-methylmethionine-dependent homocysteine/selenocysteine methylase